MGKKKRGGGGEQQQQKAAAEHDNQDHQQQQQGGDDHLAAAPSSADAHTQQIKSASPEAEEKGKEKDKEKEKAKDEGKGNKEKEAAKTKVVTAVLKVDMHCDGCANRIRASIRHYPGVEGVAMEVEKGIMTVVGRFDATKLRDRVASKTKKKVDLLTGNNNNKKGGGNNNKGANEYGDGKPEQEDGGGEEKKKGQGDDEKSKGKDGDNNKANSGAGAGEKGKGGGKDRKKPVVPVVGTVVLKIGGVGLHCDGCMHRIRSKLFHIDGVEQVSMEMGKNQVTVIGTMDIKALPEKLHKKLGRPVDVVQPNNKQKQQQDGKEKHDGKDAKEKALTAEKDAWKAAFYDQQSLLATEYMLSDENPNACTIA
uniref:HMA domain-containing protein n=1 Tax=Leersia perrieri TaxID=77586 RepID=A0A0D9VMQ8_9ORYZ